MSGRLSIAPCSRFMAKQAVGRWHYSRNMPGRYRWNYGVHEDGRFIGACLFDTGATPVLATRFGLDAAGDEPEVLELLRVALSAHATPVSRILTITIRQLRRALPRLRLLVSFADTLHGHHGGIYQAAGWIYTGVSVGPGFTVNGSVIHGKSLYERYGVGGQSIPWLRANVDPQATRTLQEPKHRYLLPLDDEMRAIVASLAKPYPKRAGSIVSDVAANHAEEGGANPTSALDLFGEVA